MSWKPQRSGTRTGESGVQETDAGVGRVAETRDALARLRDDAVDEQRLEAARAYVFERTSVPRRMRLWAPLALTAVVMLTALFVAQERWPRVPELPALPLHALAIDAPEVRRWPLSAREPAPSAQAATRFVYVAETEVEHEDGSVTKDAVVQVIRPGSNLQILWMIPEPGDD